MAHGTTTVPVLVMLATLTFQDVQVVKQVKRERNRQQQNTQKGKQQQAKKRHLFEHLLID